MSAVPLIDYYSQFMAILSSLTDYGEYSSLEVALADNPGFALIEGPKVTAVGQSVLSPNVGPLVEYSKAAVELDGGVGGYSTIIDVTEASGEAVAVEATGVFAGWTIGTAVVGALAGAGVGIAMYDSNPQFWVDVSNALFPGEDIDYDSIKDYSIIGLIKESLFGSENEATTYLSEDIINKIYEIADNYGYFTYETTATVEDSTVLTEPDTFVRPFPFFTTPIHSGNNVYDIDVGSNVYAINSYSTSSGRSRLMFVSENYFEAVVNGVARVGSTDITARGKTYYYASVGEVDLPYTYTTYYQPGAIPMWDIAYCIFEGITRSISPDGVYVLPDADLYNPNQPLGDQYPNWVGREVTTNAIQLPYDDPSLYPLKWIPVKMPDTDPIQHPEKYPTPSTEPMPEPIPYPATEPQPDAQRGRLPATFPEPYQFPTQDAPRKDPQTGEDKPPNTDPPITPTPTPPIIFPTIGGEANALFTVYNPILSELNSLAGVLWTSNFLTNLMKIFTNNPMDAIISLHLLFATPHTGGRKNIVLGCYDTGVESTVVDKQYLQIDCGTVTIPEYFGDARDYVNSVVDVYLPFVGMRHLKTQDIIGSFVTIKAGIDVFTGTILYTINVRKSSGINQVMYCFEGNCAVVLPLTGADKSRMFSALGSIAVGAAAGGSHGGGVPGAVVGGLVGGFNSVMGGSQQADVQRTSNFSANSGAMGVKKPYIVVSRNIGYDANNYNHFHGFPANKTVRLSNCIGFTRVQDVRVSGIAGATDNEKTMIENYLKTGVII